MGLESKIAEPLIGSLKSRLLDSGTRQLMSTHGATVRRLSTKYGLDWRLVLAVIRAESQFDTSAKSPKGADGLMQIMPETGAEVARALEIDVMAGPSNNIHAGIFYLRRLHDMFPSAPPEDRIKLTLAAYNAGVGRIYDAQDVAAYLEGDPNSWTSVRDALPLLSKRYYTLHKGIWEDDKPRGGWFGSSRETVAYVNKVLGYYDEYRLVLS
jgi:membrane-bound lytic murein transglycosylase F